MTKRTLMTNNGGLQVRSVGDDKWLDSYFVRFDDMYHLFDNVYERVDSHAIDETINDDIRALINHDTTLVLGRSTNKTLFLDLQECGLWGETLINQNDQDALNLYARVQRGDVTGCSFGFDILEEEREVENGKIIYVIKKIKLYEVSICTFPAYEATEVSCRAKQEREIEKKRNMEWRLKQLDKIRRIGKC